MVRPLRIEYDGAIYHVTSRGNERKNIFKDDEDRLLFLNILKKVIEKYNWLCHAYCLMNNHYHLVIETPDRGTAGFEKPHPCLNIDWVLGQFSRKRGIAVKKYQEFVKAGIGERRIWKSVKGQIILGKEDFVEKIGSSPI